MQFKRAHEKTLISAVASVVGTFIPVLTPFLSSIAGSALPMNYVKKKSDEVSEKRILVLSLFGVFATGKRSK